MNRNHIVPVAGALALLVLLATVPRAARAQDFNNIDPGTAEVISGMVGGFGLMIGAVSDIGIASGYASSGTPGVGWGVLGSLSWGAVTVYTLFALPAPGSDNWMPDGFNFVVPAAACLNLVYAVVALGQSLNPPDEAKDKAKPKHLVVAPSAVIGPAGHAAPGLSFAGHF